MVSFAPASSARLLPPSSVQFPFLSRRRSHSPVKFKPPHFSRTSISSSYSLPPTSVPAASIASFPYSLLQHRHHPKLEDPVNEGRRVDSNQPRQADDDDFVIGNRVVFEEGAFEEEIPFFGDQPEISSSSKKPSGMVSSLSSISAGDAESLIPEKWREVVAEINMTQKEKREIVHRNMFGSRLNARKKTFVPGMEDYLTYRDMKLSQLNPVVLDYPKSFPQEAAVVVNVPSEYLSVRMSPKNPRMEISGETMADITEFLNSEDYVPDVINDDKKPQAHRKLFTKDESRLLNKRHPNLAEATSRKWLPLHTLASSGEFYLLNLLLKQNVDINAVDEDGLTAIHTAILSKKQAITCYLLNNFANPFVLDMDGATLMHYAVHTASTDSINILVLYNVDINLADNDGWTPLHLAVQMQRIDIVRLLLSKGADTTLKNQDGLRPLDLCLYCGHSVRTLRIIKLLKQFANYMPHEAETHSKQKPTIGSRTGSSARNHSRSISNKTVTPNQGRKRQTSQALSIGKPPKIGPRKETDYISIGEIERKSREKRKEMRMNSISESYI